MEKSKSTNQVENLSPKREKIEIISKINLIYDSKLIYDVIGGEIRIKT